VPQKYYPVQPKLTLVEFDIQLMISQSLQNYPQVLLVLFRSSRIYQDIINEDNHKLIQIRLKYPIHHIHVTTEAVEIIRKKLKTAQNRQRDYVDRCRRLLEFSVGDHVFLKISPMKRISRFGMKGKLGPRFVGPFEIL